MALAAVRSKEVVLLLFGVLPTGCWSSVLVFVYCALLCVLSSFAIILKGREGWFICFYCLMDVLFL